MLDDHRLAMVGVVSGGGIRMEGTLAGTDLYLTIGRIFGILASFIEVQAFHHHRHEEKAYELQFFRFFVQQDRNLTINSKFNYPLLQLSTFVELLKHASFHLLP
uniref:Uncharacterized protein n=1 Tax=Meloidogyne incognita TaxID=6306 RepID=A0A914M4U1_MELIC